MKCFNQIIEINLLNTLCFIDRWKNFRFSKGLAKEKEKKSEKKSGAI